jgi:DNA-binding transcriptional ArsR family regulator
MAEPEKRVQLRDARTLGALAHPVRLALLDHLMAFGPRTASECAEVIGGSASNCSWHLRHLARFGLVERVESEDGRERPWRAAATGFDFGGPAEEPAIQAVTDTLEALELEEDVRLTRAYLDRREQAEPEWRRAAIANTYALRLTADELAGLEAALDAAIRPYIGLTRADPPPGAEPVHLSLRAFRRPETL